MCGVQILADVIVNFFFLEHPGAFATAVLSASNLKKCFMDYFKETVLALLSNL